ncbi:MAG: KpsF/GutQ family sugar-phosphate isomerase [Alphaproteobacteria bacterium]|nr:KpsF/GutQ family sugar-phosphate isomerase [Alphaproteobacteria bacterium]
MNDNEDKNHAVRVLKDEAEALLKLAASIDHNFSNAVETVHAMKTAQSGAGRLIIAGIGKSGHVARKIAATLASTGTPSYFVHPGEASHGDMGMITERDVVLILSNSGENAELSDLIHYTRRFGIPLIAITSKPESTLARHADTTLLLPKVPEACPNGLAPTTSTTMMIALGDALAVALLERMGLTPEQYKVFHPGGKLGQRLMKVSELMIAGENLPTVAKDARMDEALLVLTGKNMGAVLIFDENKNLLGMITDGDLKRHMSPDLLQKPAAEIMTTSPKTISQNALAVEALDIMTKTPGRYITSLIVTGDDGKACGMIRLQDCLQAGIA